jgi:hypothetical protein
MTVNVLEIRNYLLKPNVLEHFIDYFEEHFIASQEAEHMTLLGQFRLIDEPDHFVWIRGFHDMPTRQKALQNFYGGSVWAKYGPLANEMMLEWHNVHLLRPLSDIDLMNGMTTERIAADLAAGTISLSTGLIAIDFYQLHADQHETMQNIVQAYQKEGIQIRGQCVAEMSENTFARLPVYQYEDIFVLISAYESPVAAVKRDRTIQNLAEQNIRLHPNANSLLLSPTLRYS